MEVAVDLVVLTVRDGRLSVLLVESPQPGRMALPGGLVRAEEDLRNAAGRELADRTGITTAAVHLEQLATYGAPDRVPGVRVVTVAYLTVTADLPDPVGATWWPVATGPLAYDHDAILAEGVERARSKLEYTPLATAFVTEPFRISDLRAVYEVVWGEELDSRNFHRKVTSVPGLLEPTGHVSVGERGRPAQLFRRGPADLLLPPLLRAALRS